MQREWRVENEAEKFALSRHLRQSGQAAPMSTTLDRTRYLLANRPAKPSVQGHASRIDRNLSLDDKYKVMNVSDASKRELLTDEDRLKVLANFVAGSLLEF